MIERVHGAIDPLSSNQKYLWSTKKKKLSIISMKPPSGCVFTLHLVVWWWFNGLGSLQAVRKGRGIFQTRNVPTDEASNLRRSNSNGHFALCRCYKYAVCNFIFILMCYLTISYLTFGTVSKLRNFTRSLVDWKNWQ